MNVSFSVFTTVWFAVTLCLCYVVGGGNESFLIREVLLKNYDPFVRPVTDPRTPVFLKMSVGIKSFVELDMKKQTLTTFGWLVVNWYDSHLTWDTDEFPYSAVYLASDMIWRPELVIFNTVKKLDELENQKIKVIVTHDGKVTWFPGGLLETVCPIDITHYPLDTQTCSIDVTTWSLNKDLLNGTFNVKEFEVANTERHPEWSLVGTEAAYSVSITNYWTLHFKFSLRRKVLFYVVNVVMPIVLLSLMNCLVFLLPVESGEKMTVSVTVFLSFAVFMSLINDSLPQNSDSLCLFSAYIARGIRIAEKKPKGAAALTSFIGFAIAKRLCEDGAKVVISSRKQKNVDAAVQELRNLDLPATGVVCHVGKKADRDRLLAETVQQYGGIDILVSNAAANPYYGPLLDMIGAYSVSKTALLGLTKTLAPELAGKNIRVNCLAPGIIKTKFSRALWENDTVHDIAMQQVPMGRMGTPEDCAGTVSFLVSDDANYITGETVVVSGGMTSRL
nr:hypothetical protein BaRGS_011116 [Batillaria attramentaria]